MSQQAKVQSWIAHSRPDITSADQSAVQRCLMSGMITSGDETLAFAEEIAARYAYQHALCCGSGTQALYLILSALGIGGTDEVIVPTYVCHSVADAVILAGARPVFCDVDALGLIDANMVAPQMTKRTRAIIVVHLFGVRCDIESLEAFGLPIIEDFAQHMDRPGRMAGQSAAGFFSFHPTKCLTAGMGGMLACDNDALFYRIQALAEDSAQFVPLPNMNAALGRSQLKRYDGMLERRMAIAQRYFAGIPAPWTDGMHRCKGADMFYRFCIRKHDVPFERVQARFASAHIHVRRGVDELLHVRFQTGQRLPSAERLFEENISLPIYPALSDEELQRILEVCKVL